MLSVSGHVTVVKLKAACQALSSLGQRAAQSLDGTIEGCTTPFQGSMRDDLTSLAGVPNHQMMSCCRSAATAILVTSSAGS